MLAVLALMLASASDAQARVMFGADETIHIIGPTNDPEVNLGYLTSTYFLLAGCYVEDKGYVLTKKGDRKTYQPLDDKLKAELQAAGILPNPLPAYKLGIFDYLLGYSLWIILAFVVGIPLVKKALGKNQAPATS
jgi:hypothetical protein